MRKSGRAARPWKTTLLQVAIAAVAVATGLQIERNPRAVAAPPSSQPSPFEASTSDASRHDSAKSIPMEKLSPEDRAKVDAVVSNPSIFRRMPTKVVDCDPGMYLFLVRHPDVVVNIWEIMKVSRIQLRQVEENRFRLTEPVGAVADFEFVFRSHDTHILYGEGSYDGPLMTKPAKGRGVLVLKCGYVRETNGRYYITSRLDCFLTVEPAGIELLTKTVSPLMGKTVDNNFIQTAAFISSLSRTAEVNRRGVQRLASQLKHVEPDVRTEFQEVVADMAQKSSVADASESTATAVIAGRPDIAVER